MFNLPIGHQNTDLTQPHARDPKIDANASFEETNARNDLITELALKPISISVSSKETLEEITTRLDGIKIRWSDVNEKLITAVKELADEMKSHWQPADGKEISFDDFKAGYENLITEKQTQLNRINSSLINVISNKRKKEGLQKYLCDYRSRLQIITDKKEHCEWYQTRIQDLTKRILIDESQLASCKNYQALLAGRSIRTSTADVLFNRWDPTKNTNIPEINSVEAFREKEQDLREHLWGQIPEFPLDLDQLVGVEKAATWFPNNNYLLDLDVLENVSYNPENQQLIVIGDDGLKETIDASNVIFNEDGKGVFGESRMCDDGRFDWIANKFFIGAFNDGNNWGVASQHAAISANSIAIDDLRSQLKLLWEKKAPLTSRDIIRAHDNALSAAQNALGKTADVLDEEGKNGGTTCPQLLTVVGNMVHISSVGDSKCFIVGRDLSVREPTYGARGGFSTRDPGGRIGESAGADLRNYAHYVDKVNPGDMVVMCSDGIHDNFDPKHLGLIPSQLDITDSDEWNVNNPIHEKVREQYKQTGMQQVLLDYMKEIQKSTLDPKEINEALYRHIQKVTLTQKLFQTRNPSAKMPEDYIMYTGKPDHAGVLIYEHPYGLESEPGCAIS